MLLSAVPWSPAVKQCAPEQICSRQDNAEQGYHAAGTVIGL